MIRQRGGTSDPSPLRSKRFEPGLATSIALLVMALASGCGGSDEEAVSAELDGAFLVEMASHHEAAIEMAEVAQKRAEHREVVDLAKTIIASQGKEIEKMKQIHASLFEGSFNEADHGSLGLEEHEVGMAGDMAELENARPFDRAFIDLMIPHHQGAMLMARRVLEGGSSPQVAALANDIIEAQSGEIEAMNEWREDWYGEPSPAGGIPATDEPATGGGASPHDGMGH
jgi:uncharacterized protein (DUF305 family)